VAGWGLVWGLVAGTLPLLALWRVAERRPLPGALVSAIRITAAAGVVAVVVMLAVSAAERTLCLGCFGTYLLVAGYAGIALFGWQAAGLPDALRGLGVAAVATLVGFLVLLYPGLATPRRPVAEGRGAIEGASLSVGTGDPETDRHLQRFVDSLSAPLQQTLSDSLHSYRNARSHELPAPRHRIGSASAPVRITEWTDVLCDHCAELHTTLEMLAAHLPPGSFSAESRQFPLDGACNPLLPPRESASERCVAAKVRICLEGHEAASELAQELFASQRPLTPERVLELAATHVDRESLEACVAAAETQAKLEQDVALAARYDPDGTPIVAVNGRRGTSFAPFLYVIVLTRGSPDHPAFAKLPPPNPNAHLH
jgi:serine/threonine-protein kinase